MFHNLFCRSCFVVCLRSKYGHRCKLSTSLDKIERQVDLSLPNRDAVLHDCASPTKNLESTYRPCAQNLEACPVDQVLSSYLPKAMSNASAPWSAKRGENIKQPKKRARTDMKKIQITEHTLQALKKQRSEGFIGSDSLTYGAFGHDLFGNGSNGVCLAIAAPMITDKAKLQHAIKSPVMHSRSLVDKHQKTLAERCEAQM